MPGFDGTGPRSMGPMTGGGRGYCVIPLTTREEELDYLKERAQVLREQLKQIEAHIREIEKPKGAVSKE